jgi:hypothetical protein
MFGHLSSMATVSLVHPQGTFQVSGRMLVQKSNLFSNNLALITSPYHVQSHVSLTDFRDFVSALEGHRSSNHEL